MKLFRITAFVLGLIWSACAQIPHLAYVYPAGGKTGTTFQVTVGGQFLMSVSNAMITGPGVQVSVLDRSRPMNQKEFNELRDRLKALQEKFQNSRKGLGGTNSWTAADTAERLEIRNQILRNPPNRTANPAMIDTVILRVAVAANATPGEREIRLATPNTLSNPLRFCLGTLPEISRPAAKPANPDLDKYIEKLGGQPAPAGTPKNEARVNLPATINGQILPGGVDRYRFLATHGQHLILVANARSLIPYLADAVPGWFESVLTIFDAKGRELASNERFHLRPDPVIHFEVPHDGEYTVEIHDSIFRGREDFVYRLTIGEIPYVTGIFPLGGRAGEVTPVRLEGWNLPEKIHSVDNTKAEPGITTLAGNYFNPVPFSIDQFPETTEREPNNKVSTAQSIALPVIVNGHIGQPGEHDFFKFTGRTGQKIVAEVVARRLDSPLDSFLRLTDATGKTLAANDDSEDKGTGLNTHHADSYLTATLPMDGTYYIQVSDTQGRGRPDFAYRLRVSDPRPDFALRIVPSSLSLRAGMSVPVTAFALRRDGFTNAINLDLKTAPEGFSLSGARIAEGQDKAQFTLKAPAQAPDKMANITLSGHALIAGALVTHDAVPADDLMQAFFYRHLVPAKELAVSVSGQQRWFMREAFKILSSTPAKIPHGGTVRVRISAPPGNFSDRFQLVMDNAPEGISLTNVTVISTGLELVFACDAEKAKAGSTGNLICDLVPKNQSFPAKQKKFANTAQRNSLVTLPAIPFTVLAD
ncbi:MAG: PPC domain-containing protein [Verrucomicrobiota bacterium]